MKSFLFTATLLASTMAFATNAKPSPAPGSLKVSREQAKVAFKECKKELAGNKKKLDKTDRPKMRECLEKKGVIHTKK